MKKLIIIPILCLLAVTSCKKHKNPCTSSGLVYYRGDVAIDGCDWVININGTEYHPETLDIGYQQDSLTMYMDYELTGDTFVCGWGTRLPVVRFTCKYWPEE
jgi:hypothetical protein